jgi:shikimate kinase
VVHVVLLGLMGVGKTTVGDLLADRLHCPHRDSDRDIEARTGRTGRQIAEHNGVDALHQLEIELLLDALEAEVPAVISAAGFVVESHRCRHALGLRATSVWLDLPVQEVLARMHTGHHRRDMTDDEVRDLAARREPLFRAVADVVVDARFTPVAIVDEVMNQLMPDGAPSSAPESGS